MICVPRRGRALNPVSTFYDRTSRLPSVRAVADAAVAERIEAIWERSRRSYGAPHPRHAGREGIRVGRKRVERLMRQLGIAGAHLHKHWKTTRQDSSATAAPDLVERDFTAAAPNTLWVADLTYVKPLQGILYLPVVLDVFSRKVVGWQMADTMTTDLVLSAVEMGLWRRDVVRDGLIITAITAPHTPRCCSPNASPTPARHPPPDRSATATTTPGPNRSSAA
jgi:putative transposase